MLHQQLVLDNCWIFRRICSKICLSKFFFDLFQHKDLYGEPKTKTNIQLGVGQKNHYFGEEVTKRKEVGKIHRPIDKGIIQNFNIMELIWQHTFFDELRVDPEEHPVIMNEEPGNTKENREKTFQIMFESFITPGFFLEQSSVLSIYCSGRATGTVLNMGETKNDVCCVHQGKVLPTAEISYLAGKELTNFLMKSLTNSGHDLGKTEFQKFETARDIKEKLCYVRNSKNKKERFYNLPDGKMISLEEERYLTTDLLFNKLNDAGGELSLQEMVSNCIQSKDNQFQDILFNNIILNGAGSLFDGISKRLEKELKPYYSKKVKIIAPPERKYSHWFGASILSSMSSFQSKWNMRGDYEEFGPEIFKRIIKFVNQINFQEF
jgi:actin, other eukaryote